MYKTIHRKWREKRYDWEGVSIALVLFMGTVYTDVYLF